MHSLGSMSTMAVCEVNHENHMEPGQSARNWEGAVNFPAWEVRSAEPCLWCLPHSTSAKSLNCCVKRNILAITAHVQRSADRFMFCFCDVYVLSRVTRILVLKRRSFHTTVNSYCANLLLVLQVKIPFLQYHVFHLFFYFFSKDAFLLIAMHEILMFDDS